jgi:hypothetical protein
VTISSDALAGWPTAGRTWSVTCGSLATRARCRSWAAMTSAVPTCLYRDTSSTTNMAEGGFFPIQDAACIGHVGKRWCRMTTESGPAIKDPLALSAELMTQERAYMARWLALEVLELRGRQRSGCLADRLGCCAFRVYHAKCGQLSGASPGSAAPKPRSCRRPSPGRGGGGGADRAGRVQRFRQLNERIQRPR